MKETLAVLGLALVLVGCGGNTTQGNDSVLGDRSRPTTFGDNAASGRGAHGAMAESPAPAGMKVEQTSGDWRFVRISGPKTASSNPGTDTKTPFVDEMQAHVYFEGDKPAQGALTTELKSTDGSMVSPCLVTSSDNLLASGQAGETVSVGIYGGLPPEFEGGTLTLGVRMDDGSTKVLAEAKVSGLKPERKSAFVPSKVVSEAKYAGGETVSVKASRGKEGTELSGAKLTMKLDHLDPARTYMVRPAVLESTWSNPRPAQFEIGCSVSADGVSTLSPLWGNAQFAKDLRLAVQLRSRAKSSDVDLKISGVTMIVEKGAPVGLDFSKARISGDQKGSKIGLPDPPVVKFGKPAGILRFAGVDSKKLPGFSLTGSKDWLASATADGFHVSLNKVVEGPFEMELKNSNSWDKSETREFTIHVEGK